MAKMTVQRWFGKDQNNAVVYPFFTLPIFGVSMDLLQFPVVGNLCPKTQKCKIPRALESSYSKKPDVN